ncbi:MAG TPA: tRNA pseudouridine(38-40) synthase TruA [Armatimonadota bacterium]|jgi:tRNA pseudouridine38-40 synthase
MEGAEPQAAAQSERNLALRLQYDGTDFAGFQKQPDRRTVQGELERVLSHLCGGAVRTFGAGRTDAGVHATGQVVSFRTASPIPLDRWPLAVNGELPRDMAVTGVWSVPDGFHARYSARSRVYRYTLVTGTRWHALLGRVAWLVPWEPDLAQLQQTAALLPGVRDFRAFGTPRPEEVTTRDLRRAEVEQQGRVVRVTLEANAFLRSMARYVVAVLVAVAQGRLDRTDVLKMLETGMRGEGIAPAPAQGLCLTRVSY